MDKYKWKYRILLIETPSYNDKDYQEAKNIYQKNEYKFHQRYIKLMTKIMPKFKIKLIGFDGKIKKKYSKMVYKEIIKDIDKMPIKKIRKKKNGLSLYSNYNPKTTVEGLGFRNEEKALHTIKKIKNKDKDYQKRTLITLIYRAKYHPYQTKEMRKAIRILQKRLNILK